MNIEIELRYEVLELEQLEKFIEPFKQLHRKRDTDIYLDNQDAQLYQQGIFIRIRNNKQLDFKFNRACLDNPDLALQDYCEEHSFSLPLQQADLASINQLLASFSLLPCNNADIDHFKLANSFMEHYVVDKVRTSYHYPPFTVAIDEVVGLGTFLEIELMAATIDNLAAIKKEMEHLLRDLSLKPLKTGYGTLLLRKNDFEHYLLGRFILDEDKAHADRASKIA